MNTRTGHSHRPTRPSSPQRSFNWAKKILGCAALVVALLAPAGSSAQTGGGIAVEISEANFPHLIPVSVWPAGEGFHAGDRIAIAMVRGDRQRIEPGGTYMVQGTYSLASASTATLALSLTASGPAGKQQWAKTQFTKVRQGDGSFSFVATMHAPGKFHVSFYPANGGSSQGGLYFEKR